MEIDLEQIHKWILHSQQELQWSFGIIFCSTVLALWIHIPTTLRMFINSSLNPQSNEQGSKSWTLFRVMNWGVSWIFTWNLYQLIHTILQQQSIESVTNPRLYVTTDNRIYLFCCFLSLSYLCTSFGLSLVVNTKTTNEISKQQPPKSTQSSEESTDSKLNAKVEMDASSENTPTSLNIFQWIPVFYMIVLIGIVFKLDSDWAMRCAVSLFTLTLCGISTFIYKQHRNGNKSSSNLYIPLIFSWIGNLCTIWNLAGIFVVVWLIQSDNFDMKKIWSLFKEQDESFRAVVYSAIGIFMYWLLLAPRRPSSSSGNRIPMTEGTKNSLLKKRLRNYPPAYPNGWYVLLDSKQLKNNELKNVEALGQTFVVFRTDHGEIGVLDAYCKHMGANLAAGGKVVNDTIQCPFHEWRFSTNGECKHIPYTDSIPKSANIKSWPCMEYHGMIVVYFDAEGRDPPYFPEPVHEISNGDFVYRGELDTYVDMHIIEFCENSADFQHFACLHGQMTIPYTEIAIPGITIQHTPGFSSKDHIVKFTDHAQLKFMGKLIPRSSADAEITISGPGGTVFFRFFTELGQIVLFHMHTPVEPLKQLVRFRWYADKSMPRALVWYVVGNWISQVQADREVWENKVYQKLPVLVKNDGPIKNVRRWFQQFYSENSPHIVNGKLDW